MQDVTAKENPHEVEFGCLIIIISNSDKRHPASDSGTRIGAQSVGLGIAVRFSTIYGLGMAVPDPLNYSDVKR